MLIKSIGKLSFACASLFVTHLTHACGGFFCEILPIDQAGEQIVFHQNSGINTTMVQIQYAGSAEDFGWVLPVPSAPELSLGSDIIFQELELLTRPQFVLDREGEPCPIPQATGTANFADAPTSSEGDSGEVVIEQTLQVGPFDAQIISGDNADAIAQWLEENNLDLTDRGSELLEPYVAAQMKFVVLKLQSNQETGVIQPIIMRYESETPMIPIRLTALAAQEDMGILVWILGEERAVPENYFHVTPNYTRLNWFTGSQNAYASYQTLVTEAMDEAGGQGFATDVAGQLTGLVDSMTAPEVIDNLEASLVGLSDSLYLSEAWNGLFQAGLPQTLIDGIYARFLPSADAVEYGNPVALEMMFTQDELMTARLGVTAALIDQIRDPLANATALFEDDKYLTRLYTTLSPEEMTLDPVFVFNSDMPDQAQERRALLNASCENDETAWSLTLGEGTGREGETVIIETGSPPFSAVANDQPATFRVEKTQASSAAEIVTDNAPLLSIEPSRGVSASRSSGGGNIGFIGLGLIIVFCLLNVLFSFRPIFIQWLRANRKA